MAARSISIETIKEVLRLRFELCLGFRDIAQSCCISVGTAYEYVHRAEACGIRGPSFRDWKESDIEAALLGNSIQRCRPEPPDFELVHARRQRASNLTLRTLWLEYRESHPSRFYKYSRFCELYDSWLQKRNVVLRHEYRAGEKAFVTWRSYRLPCTPARFDVSLFIAVLGASSYVYAEVLSGRDSPQWIAAHVRMFEFYGGVPRMLVPCGREAKWLVDNASYRRMAAHYGTAVVSLRSQGHEKRNGQGEVGLSVAERWLCMRLRHQEVKHLAALREIVRELVDDINSRTLKCPNGSRRSLFDAIDASALKALPATQFDI